MKILIIGSKGQLGWELMRQGTGFDLTGVDLPELDITRPDQIQNIIKETGPDLLINAAAYTQVDAAESNPDPAYSVNRDGPAFMAQTCAEQDIPLIHISTDFVFDGRKTTPYLETDPVYPLGVYGQSKAAGDELVRNTLNRHIIVRTAWLYGVHGLNFVKTMLRLGREREELNVVSDQYGCPTAAADLAAALLTVARRIDSDREIPWGTYHFCGSGITTWHGFAEKILELGKAHMPIKAGRVNAITTAQYPTPARRPAYSALNCSRIRTHFGIEQQPWENSLKQTIDRMAAEKTLP